jgi:hypothetical protein
MKKTLLITSVLLVVTFPVGAYEADRVAMNYEPESVDTVPAPLAGACSVAIAQAADIRPNKESIGHEFKPILSGDPVPWVGTALEDLKRYGFSVQRMDTLKPVAGTIVVRPELYRTYVWHGQLRINGMVAMNVEFITPSGKHVTRKYRASGSKNNWAAATGEYMTALNYAMNNAVAKLAGDMVKLCGT